MKEDIYHSRTALLRAVLEKKFSVLTGNEILHLFKNIREEQKEEVAKEAIPLVKNSKTEKEALEKVKEMIYENSSKYQKNVRQFNERRRTI